MTSREGRKGIDAEGLAFSFHESYERLAPSFCYETRADTRKFDRDSANGKLMIAVCQEIINEMRNTAITAPQSEEPVATVHGGAHPTLGIEPSVIWHKKWPANGTPLFDHPSPAEPSLKVAGDVVQIVEGVGCKDWRDENGNRLKDTKEWMRFYTETARRNSVGVQACRPEDRDMVATDAGKELLTKAAAALSSPAEPSWLLEQEIDAHKFTKLQFTDYKKRLANDVARIMAAMKHANESGLITDTLWMRDQPETVFDAIESLATVAASPDAQKVES